MRGHSKHVEHLQAKWTPVRVKKIRENNILEPNRSALTRASLRAFLGAFRKVAVEGAVDRSVRLRRSAFQAVQIVERAAMDDAGVPATARVMGKVLAFGGPNRTKNPSGGKRQSRSANGQIADQNPPLGAGDNS
jgi:hypothetical protein